MPPQKCAEQAEGNRSETLRDSSARDGHESGHRTHEQPHQHPGDNFIAGPVFQAALVNALPDLTDLVGGNRTGVLEAGFRLVGGRANAFPDRGGGVLRLSRNEEQHYRSKHAGEHKKPNVSEFHLSTVVI